MEDLRFPTPSIAFNVLTNGGFRASSLVEVWGPTKSGKSTFSYGVASLSAKALNAGLVVIDVELSVDSTRMKRSFDLLEGPVLVGRKEFPGKRKGTYRLVEYFLEPSRGNLCSIEKDEEGAFLTKEATVYELDEKSELKIVDKIDPPESYADYCIMVCPYIEDALSRLAKLCEIVNVPLVVIYDSLAAHITKSFYTNMAKMHSGGIAEDPRVIKKFLSGLMTKMYLSKPTMVVMLLNQVYEKFNPFGGSSLTSGGGNALKHNVHYNLSFRANTPLKDESTKKILYYISNFKVEKSKFTPSFPLDGSEFTLYISEKEGGVVLEDDSFIADLFNFKIVEKPAGWIKLPFLEKSMRYDEFYDRFPELKCDLIELCREYIMNELAAVRWSYEEDGIIYKGEGCE